MGEQGAQHVVLGAGPVGRALVERLVHDGASVRVVTRHSVDGLPPGVEQRQSDVTDAGLLTQVCAGADVIYGCVGLNYGAWSERWPPMMEGMLAAAHAVGARFVFMDNLYMYGPVAGSLTEDRPLTSYGHKPATRARLTRMWQTAHASGRVKVAAVRASDFYGPAVTRAALGDLSLGRIARGQSAQCLGDVDLPHSFSYVPDVARALQTVGAASDDIFGQAWHVPNAPDRSLRALLQLFADEVKRPLKVSVLPGLVLTVGGMVNRNLKK